MDEEIIAYQEYLLSFGAVNKPYMPKFDLRAYTDNEYLMVINSVMEDYSEVDDFQLTIDYLKGD